MNPLGEFMENPPPYSMSRSVAASKLTSVLTSAHPASPCDWAKECPLNEPLMIQFERPHWLWASTCPLFWKLSLTDRFAPVVLTEVSSSFPEPSPAVARASADAETTLT